MALTGTWVKDRTGALALKWTVGEAPVRHKLNPHNSGISEGSTVPRHLRAIGSILAARRATPLPGAPSPFVTQSQLIDLVKTDRSDIERHVHQAEWMMRHPHRGTSATPYLLTADWRKLLRWLDGAIEHLKQPRPVAELEHLIRTWQDQREKIVAPNLRWRRRADVIAV